MPRGRRALEKPAHHNAEGQALLVYLHAVLLGVVQGLTEFLPVSSSAHLILGRLFFGWDAEGLGLTFDVACHVGTLAAVVTYFRRELWGMARAAPQVLRADASQPARLLRLIVIGTLPVVIVGLLFGRLIESTLRSGGTAAGMLALGAVGIFAAERFSSRTKSEDALTPSSSIGIGTAQAAALVPGVSRSGATIIAAMLFGLRRDAAARFSFLLGVPAIVAAAAHEGLAVAKAGLTPDEARIFLVGMGVSAVVGYLAIAYLLRYLMRHSLAAFAWYRLALAAAFAGWWLAGRI
jgi:undecaprenyl-diphosphatase